MRESAKVEIVCFENGRRHLLLLKDLRTGDNCMVTFQAGTASTSALLLVKGQSIGDLHYIIHFLFVQNRLCLVL